MSTADETRRRTPLARLLAKEIADAGPIGIDVYMQRCLLDPQHGYYTTRTGIGRDGDFTTAPEISQVFGELIGLWAAVVWQHMGAPSRVNLVELGPGRGVLIADALRAARILPDFIAAIDLHLCEINPAFRQLQGDQLKDLNIEAKWHAAWPQLDDCPTIVIANEFLDTIPGTQWQCDADGTWHELRVGLAGRGDLAFVKHRSVPPFDGGSVPATSNFDEIFTYSDFGGLAGKMADQATAAPIVALFIDYGHTRSAWGDTLQAVRDHQPEHPLTSPGEADLSMAVDFAAFKRTLDAVGFGVDGPISQAEFLGQLGIAERASKLMAANSARANEIESAIWRLMASPGMGTRFQTIAARSPQVGPLPGFATGPA